MREVPWPVCWVVRKEGPNGIAGRKKGPLGGAARAWYQEGGRHMGLWMGVLPPFGKNA